METLEKLREKVKESKGKESVSIDEFELICSKVLSNNKEILDKVFHSCSSNGLVDLRQFLCGLSLCVKTEQSSQLEFIFDTYCKEETLTKDDLFQILELLSAVEKDDIPIIVDQIFLDGEKEGVDKQTFLKFQRKNRILEKESPKKKLQF